MRYSFLLFLLPFFFSTANAQQSVKNKDSGWRFGLNLGGAYQGAPLGENDMDAGFGMGFGFTLGKMIHQERGDLLNLGVRGRYLWEMTTGASTERSYAIGVSPDGETRYDLDLLGEEYYQDDPGYAYQNYRQEGRQYDLELTLGLNSLAERTDILFYVFGGVGVINYQVETDQLDENGDPYDYSSIDHDAGTEAKKEQLSELWDGDYESRVYEGGKVNSFIPSGGLGVIYQINPSLGIGFEHKISLPAHSYQQDLFDGKEYKNGSSSAGSFEQTDQRDIYHYTALRFRWRLMEQKNGKDQEEAQTSSQDGQTSSIDAGPPRVDIMDPSSSPHRTDSDHYGLRARILRVDDVENVTLRVNGKEIPYPGFRPGRDLLEEEIALEKGGNQVEVHAVNEHGSDRERVMIVRETEEPPAPKVKVQDPASDPSTVYQGERQLEANVLNVDEKGDIEFQLNGSSHPFDFDPNAGELTAQLDLIQGANQVLIEVKNEVGADSDERSILYRREAKVDPPGISITYPSDDPEVVLNPNGKLKAKVEGIDSRKELTVTQNGSETEDYHFFPDNELLTMTRPLQPGNNLFRIRGENQGGTAQDEQRIILQDEQAHAPIVNFTDPSASEKTVGGAYYSLEAEISHVSRKEHVDLKMNGSEVQNFNFDHTQGKLNYSAQLQVGKNRFELSASNSQGSDQDEVIIHYQKGGGESPSVSIQEPSGKKANVSDPNVTVNAKVFEVTDRSGVTVTMNGNTITGYSFDPNSGDLSFQKELVEGSNYLKVRASNPFGSDQDSKTLLYDPERPPAVKIVDPPKGVTVQNEKYTVEAKLFRVDAASDVTLTHDGKGISQFQFDPKSGKLQALLKLSGGTNRIVVEGENDLGSDKDEVQIEYEQQTSPKVDITYPGTSPFQFGQSSVQIKGKATGIQDESEIELIANGKEVGSFQFHNGHFKHEMSLDPGQNEFVAKVQTSAGQDEDEVLIHYSSVSSYRGGGTGNEGKSSKKESSGESSQEDPSKTEKESSKKGSTKDASEGPEVSVTKPTSNSTTVEGVEVEGVVENADEVELLVNGKKLSFERSGNKIEADVPLQKGENTILLKGSNLSGSDSDQHKIEYEPMKEEGQNQKGGRKEPDEGPDPSSKEKKKQERKEQKEQEKELKKKEKKQQKKEKKGGGSSGAPKKKK